MRRGKPELLVATLILLLLGSYVWYTQRVVVDFRADARSARVRCTRASFTRSPTRRPAPRPAALLDLSQSIHGAGRSAHPHRLARARPLGHANLPFDANERTTRVPDDDPRVVDYIAILAEATSADRRLADRQDLLRRSRRSCAGCASFPSCRPLTARDSSARRAVTSFARAATRRASDCGRAWRASRRINSGRRSRVLSGWIELLEERATDDIVASRGRDTCAAISSGSIASRTASSASGANRSSSRSTSARSSDASAGTSKRACRRSPTPSPSNPSIAPDLPQSCAAIRVLLEWAVEVLTKNAIDALAGRGGRCASLGAAGRGRRRCVIRVADDGPGIPRELRARVFEPGFSTKKSGWGIGLSLAKRIVEENHGGQTHARAATRSTARRSRLSFTDVDAAR